MSASGDRVWSTRGWAFRLAGAGTLAIAWGLAYTGPALVSVAVALLGFHAGTRQARGLWYAAMGLATTAVLLVGAAKAGLGPEELGLRGGVGVSIAVLVAAAAALALIRQPAIARGLPPDAPSRPVLALLVDLPIGTVLVEEIAFRSVGLALLMSSMPATVAVVVSSLLFGLWHVWGALETSGRRRVVWASVGFTALAGAGLCVVRLWLGAVLPAMALHYAANAWGIAATALVRRRAEAGGAQT